MKRPSTTKRRGEELIEFVDEEDRVKFTKIVIDLLKDQVFKQKVAAKQAKYKSSFKIKWKNEELKDLGIEPHLVFRFKKVKKTDEWDLDIHLDKLKNAQLEEYFEKV